MKEGKDIKEYLEIEIKIVCSMGINIFEMPVTNRVPGIRQIITSFLYSDKLNITKSRDDCIGS